MESIMKTLVLFSIVCLVIPKVNSQEVCEKHNNYLDDTYEAQNCSMYCCGSCKHRYCCNSRANRLNQEFCGPEDCLAYYDVLQVHYQRAYCFGRFCCGKCNYRYCCSDTSLRLDQSSCSNKEPNMSTRKSYKSISWFYWSIAIICILIIGFYKLHNYVDRRCNQEIGNNAIKNFFFHRNTPRTLNNQPQIRNNSIDIDTFSYPRNTNPNLNNQQSNTNIADSAPEPLINYDQLPIDSSNNETDNISNTNVDEDFPPSYESLIIKDKTTEETVETNSNNP